MTVTVAVTVTVTMIMTVTMTVTVTATMTVHVTVTMTVTVNVTVTVTMTMTALSARFVAVFWGLHVTTYIPANRTTPRPAVVLVAPRPPRSFVECPATSVSRLNTALGT